MPRLGISESSLTIFYWEERENYLKKLEKKKSYTDENDYPYTCAFNGNLPACPIKMTIFKNHHMVVLHIPCNSLFLMRSFQTSFKNRKVCPVCNVSINESDTKVLLDKIRTVISDLEDELEFKRSEQRNIKQSLGKLKTEDDQEATVSIPKDSKKHSPEQKLKNIITKRSSSKRSSSEKSSVMFEVGLEALSEEIRELAGIIEELKSLEKRVVFENFYTPYISKIKMIAAFAILSFVSYYLFQTTVNYCNTRF